MKYSLFPLVHMTECYSNVARRLDSMHHYNQCSIFLLWPQFLRCLFPIIRCTTNGIIYHGIKRTFNKSSFWNASTTGQKFNNHYLLYFWEIALFLQGNNNWNIFRMPTTRFILPLNVTKIMVLVIGYLEMTSKLEKDHINITCLFGI